MGLASDQKNGWNTFNSTLLVPIESHMETADKIATWRNHGPALILLGISLLSILLLFSFITRSVPTLPNPTQLNLIYEGNTMRYGSPHNLFNLPMIGSLIWLINTIIGLVLLRNKDERFVVHLLLTITLVAQLIIWVTTLRLTNYI